MYVLSATLRYMDVINYIRSYLTLTEDRGGYKKNTVLDFHKLTCGSQYFIFKCERLMEGFI